MSLGTTTMQREPATRPANQLLVNREGRKPLFSGASNTNDANPQPQSPPSSQQQQQQQPQQAGQPSTRIPTPRAAADAAAAAAPFSSRRTLSLADAMRMARAEDEQQDERGRAAGQEELQHQPDASPSPAPRTWRGVKGGGADGNTGQRANTTETGRELARTTGNEGPLRSRLADWRSKSQGKIEFGNHRSGSDDGLSIPALVPGIEDMPLPSIEGGADQSRSTPSKLRHKSAPQENASPEKSYNWQVDQDFTAGDLQVSDSPRIKFQNRPFANRLSFDDSSNVDINSRGRLNPPGSQNTRLDKIYARERRAGDDSSAVASPRNTKLDEIGARERDVERQIPVPDRHLTRLRNMKLNEIKQREEDGLSKRQEAAIRLSEIKEQNSMSRSPDGGASQNSRRDMRTTTPSVEPPESNIPRIAYEGPGERVPDTPVTIYKSRRNMRAGADDAESSSKGPVEGRAEGPVEGRAEGRAEGSAPSRPGALHARAGSHDLLRRLARAASTSPGPQTDAKGPPTPPKTSKRSPDKPAPRPARTSRRATANPSNGHGSGSNGNNGSRRARPEIREPNDSLKPTVGFAGLRRVQSTESTKSQRSSMFSEADPTDRIQAEMNLFAPADNHSERGSMRASSPEESEDEGVPEATPKARNRDPMSMPTPRVTGAYVETPATLRAGKVDIDDDDTKSEGDKPGDLKSIASLRDKKPELAWRNSEADTASDPGVGDSEDAVSTAAERRPRTRSLPRRRPPPRNSAKPLSAKEDLLQLRREHNIDDSTLEDLGDLLSDEGTLPIKRESVLRELKAHAIDYDNDLEKPDQKKQPKPKREKDLNGQDELKDIERMDRKILRVAQGIQSTKQGIGRMMQGSVSHDDGAKPADAKLIKMEHTRQHIECPACAASPRPATSVVAYIHLPVPRLYHRSPRLRLTLLGAVLLLASLWYAAESATCALYCRPQACAAPPCVWSFDDPTFGAAIPVKLDQAATGGRGRALFGLLREEVEDWAADVLDGVQGRSVADVDAESLPFARRRQHRRRLRKKGLAKKPLSEAGDDDPDRRAKWDAWRQARLARERVREAREMGRGAWGDADEGATVGGDERVWW